MLRVEDLTENEKSWYDFITTTRMRIRKTSAEALAQLEEMRKINADTKKPVNAELGKTILDTVGTFD